MYNAEKRGKRQVLVRPVSKVVIKFLQVMQKHGTFTFSFSTKRDETRVRREGETLMEFFFRSLFVGEVTRVLSLHSGCSGSIGENARSARPRGLGGRLDFYARKEDRSGGKDPCLEIFLVVVVVVGPRRRRRRRKKQTALFSS